MQLAAQHYYCQYTPIQYHPGCLATSIGRRLVTHGVLRRTLTQGTATACGPWPVPPISIMACTQVVPCMGRSCRLLCTQPPITPLTAQLSKLLSNMWMFSHSPVGSNFNTISWGSLGQFCPTEHPTKHKTVITTTHILQLHACRRSTCHIPCPVELRGTPAEGMQGLEAKPRCRPSLHQPWCGASCSWCWPWRCSCAFEGDPS